MTQPKKPDTTSENPPIDPPKPIDKPDDVFSDFKKLIESTDAKEWPSKVADYQARRDQYSEEDRAKIDSYLKEKLG